MTEPKTEDALIAWIRKHVARESDDLLIGVGDDMAMIRTSGAAGLLVTSDMLMDGVHFDSTIHSPQEIGRKALAVNLSDCAAMAVRPRWVMISVSLPNAWSMDQARQLLDGIGALADEFDCRIIGGDTNSWDKSLVIDITVLAEPWRIEKNQAAAKQSPVTESQDFLAPVRRAGMKPNDLIVITGELGGSLAGHHLRFTPRIAEARRLRIRLGDALHAMMDISDGLSIDAARLARASGCGITFKSATLETAASASARDMAAKDGRTILDHILNDGEDFELLLAVDPTAWMSLEKSWVERGAGRDARPVAHRVVGNAIQGEGIWMIGADGASQPIPSRGWQHFHD